MKVVIISDIHSNIQALEAVMADLGREPAGGILCAGDVVGYGANPNECCELISTRCRRVVMGDYSAVSGDTYLMNPYAARAAAWTSKALSRRSRDFLASLPRDLHFGAGTSEIGLYHGSPRSMSEYIFESDLDGEVVGEAQADIVVLGHTHVPFVRKLGEVLVVNPGSVGQPRDNDPRASYAVIDAARMTCEIRRVQYDIEGAAEAIAAAGLPGLLGDRLYLGT